MREAPGGTEVLGRGERLGCGHLVARGRHAYRGRCWGCHFRDLFAPLPDPDDLDADPAWSEDEAWDRFMAGTS